MLKHLKISLSSLEPSTNGGQTDLLVHRIQLPNAAEVLAGVVPPAAERCEDVNAGGGGGEDVEDKVPIARVCAISRPEAEESAVGGGGDKSFSSTTQEGGDPLQKKNSSTKR